MKCKSCKWWYNDSKIYICADIIAPLDPDTFEPMILPFEVNCCNCPKITFFERPVESDGATVVDGSQYRANLITAPDFGCVHHTSK